MPQAYRIPNFRQDTCGVKAKHWETDTHVVLGVEVDLLAFAGGEGHPPPLEQELDAGGPPLLSGVRPVLLKAAGGVEHRLVVAIPLVRVPSEVVQEHPGNGHREADRSGGNDSRPCLT